MSEASVQCTLCHEYVPTDSVCNMSAWDTWCMDCVYRVAAEECAAAQYDEDQAEKEDSTDD